MSNDTVTLACLLVLFGVALRCGWNLSEDDVRRITREEVNEAVRRMVPASTAQRARLMTGLRKP